ncbi:unnamed protein product [Arabis nemorensis]|uniref:KIB1-4 beta-propeller domain-containing protein n=1 Tax=Arabis nemorensis TaxID=586526 RepID=A0A565CKK8_9BRAS|nr:unnamed protein product [Arabis nemorensis]
MAVEKIRTDEFTYDFVISSDNNIAVTTSGEVLLVVSNLCRPTKHKSFTLYKMDPNSDPDDLLDLTKLVEVDSLGDEALLLDSGITVPADHTRGIEPNSIYFTRHDRVRSKKCSYLDVCVYNFVTKTIKRFPGLSNLNIKDALWFVPFLHL